jgi:uncharacterized protein (DUF305 family)
MSNRTRTAAVIAIAVATLAASSAAVATPDHRADLARSTAMSAPFDRAFIDAMVPHHQAAIEMAKMAKMAGLSRPPLMKIANAIIATQGKEIAQMRSWRKAWYGSARIDPNGMMALGLSMSDMGMSGGANDLMNAKNVNTAFASMMIAHHQGAVRMARLALTRAQHPQIRALAQRIIAGQTRETRVMRTYTG